jgi:SHS2 domain-containing protein
VSARFEVLDHPADLALRIYGRDLRELFANAAYAMFCQFLPEGLERLPVTVERQVEVDGIDDESLLVNWLNELLYLHETRGELYSQFELEPLAPGHLRASVRGAPSERSEIIIKAATFNELAIARTAEGLVVTVVLDV